jgi:Putative peptidase family./NPCBM/NEW2 domain.
MRSLFFLVGIFLACTTRSFCAVAPVPETEQAALATKIIDAYHDKRPAIPPKKLHIVYFTPSDRNPEPRYQERLTAIMEDIQTFYRDGMVRAGFGPKTFNFDRDSEGKIIFHLVKGKEPESAFPRPLSERMRGDPIASAKVIADCRPALKDAGISFDRETILIFCDLANWDEKARTFQHHSPYAGRSTQTSGLCFALDTIIQNLDDVAKKEPILKDAEWGNESLGKFNTIFIGGVAHELGHAFALPHCGERWDEKPLGTSIMGDGNHTYHNERRGEDKGSFLTMASAMRLAARPIFNGSDKDETKSPLLEECTLTLSTNLTRSDLAPRKGPLRLEGTITGSPPIYGVVAYFDSRRNNQSPYHAPTATSVPDAQGRFALEVSDLDSCSDGQVRVEFCHANGAISQRHIGFTVTPDGCTDLSQWEIRSALEPIAQAVAMDKSNLAQGALGQLEKGNASEQVTEIARKLIATFHPDTNSNPADAPSTVKKLPLGDARAQSAEVGWLKPAQNRVPTNDNVPSPLLDSGKIYATGLYAHSPSRYEFHLGGKWETLHGEAGIHSLHQAYAAGVVFVIKTDGKEVFRSPVIRGSSKARYDLNISGAKSLELIVEKATDRNSNNWSLWLDPTLFR